MDVHPGPMDNHLNSETSGFSVIYWLGWRTFKEGDGFSQRSNPVDAAQADDLMDYLRGEKGAEGFF